MTKKDCTPIKVIPHGHMVMVQVDIMAKAINGIHVPPEARYNEALRRAEVLAVGNAVTAFKPGDKVYFTTHASCIEVEHFARTQLNDDDKGQVFLLLDDNIPAKLEYAEIDNWETAPKDVVPGLSTEEHRKAQDMAAQIASENAALFNAGRKIIQ